jgi:hypothetical protein
MSLPCSTAPPPPNAPSFSKDAHHPTPPAPPGVNANLFGAKGRGPAPPSGPMSKSLQSGQAMSRRSNLKPLHWVKVTRAMQGSLWAEGQKTDDVSKYLPNILNMLMDGHMFVIFYANDSFS